MIAHPLLNDNQMIFGTRYLNARAVETDEEFKTIYESMRR